MRTKIFFYALSLAFLAFIGCSEDENNGNPGETTERKRAALIGDRGERTAFPGKNTYIIG